MSKIDTFASIAKIGANRPNKLKDVATVAKITAKYGVLGLRDRLHQQIVANEVEVGQDSAATGSLVGCIKFSVLMPTYNVDVRWVTKAVDSVLAQSYSNWELCIVDDCSSSSSLKDYLLSLDNDKIHVRLLETNLGISGATNCAAEMASGDYLVLLDNDDAITPNALFELFLRDTSDNPDIMYSDNDVIDENGNRLSVLFKPDWSPDLMLSQMYVGHLLAFRKELFDRVGGFRTEFNGSQDYDLFLRLALHTDCISHISKILYSWRALPSSTASNPGSKPYAQTAGLKAIQSYLDSKYGEGNATACETDDLFVYDVRYGVPYQPLVSIVIPTKDHVDDVRVAIDSIIKRSSYQNFEIIVLDNNSEEAPSRNFLASLPELDTRIRVLDASFPFNWSKLNNYGVRHARGDVFVFLNNDTEVISEDWLDRLVEQAMREDVGVVGGLLLYPDGTIQHAGVIVGMGGWADHVYKGAKPVHCGNPFISPMVTRNVSAVTGACMAISREHFDQLGGFNEDFIVCGSDVELCLNAMEHGLRNVYSPYIKLKHYESKTRDAKDIPEIDFRLSEAMYRPFRSSGDPFYNGNLDYFSTSPMVLSKRERLQRGVRDEMHVSMQEVRPLKIRHVSSHGKRLNILLPSVNPEDVYGGISTALKFYNRLRDELSCDGRIVVLDAHPRFSELGPSFEGYSAVALGDDSSAHLQVVSAVDRHSASLPFTDDDVFICTCWWSAFCLQQSMGDYAAAGHPINPMLYLIQDYEPGFYAWSSQYVLAESTYRSQLSTIAIFNSEELHEHFVNAGYSFQSEFTFQPFLNPSLASALEKLHGTAGKRRQILVYGRPGTVRNAFELVVDTLRQWVETDEASLQWQFISAGEDHPPVHLGKGRYLTSVGKLSLEEYARVLSESFAGLSYMVSPHPSYPPLEMASFGVRVLTNAYGVKDLSKFSSCVESLPVLTPANAAQALSGIANEYRAEVPCGDVPSWYLKCDDPFPFIEELVVLIK